MSWEAWPKADEKGLARYASPAIAERFRLARANAAPSADGETEGVAGERVGRTPSTTAALLAAGDLEAVAGELFAVLATKDIRWAPAAYHPELPLQNIRPPATILDGAGDATCLDLALLFAGAALGNGLLPLVVVLDGHALVAISRMFRRSECDGRARQAQDGTWVRDGVLVGAQAARAVLVDSGNYTLVECTGFARDDGALDSRAPEGRNRLPDGTMTFESARTAGREQFDVAERSFQFAIDLAVLQDKCRITPFGAVPAGPDLRVRLDPIRKAYDRMFGRDAELERLVRFVTGSPSGYFLVTGDAGSGKTTLLNGLIRRFEKTDVHVVYQFINRQHGTADNEQDFLQALLQQVFEAWNVTERPDGTSQGMAARLAELLDARSAPRTPVLIVIDGVDEARGWKVSGNLFPSPLPAGVHVVISARDVSDRDWRKELGLVDAGIMELEPLTDAEVADFVRQAEVPAWVCEPAALRELTHRAEGDAFYLAMLCTEVREGRIGSIGDLTRLGPGLDAFFKQWWSELQGTTSQASVEDLLSYLTIALAPMLRDELTDISDSDALRGGTIDDAVGKIARYVIGDADDVGLTLAHWRFKDYLDRRILRGDLKPARSRLTEWCGRWNEHHSRYAVTRVVAHLLRGGGASPGRSEDDNAALAALVIDDEYQRLRVEQYDDVAGLLTDLGNVLRAFVAEPRPDAARVVTAALAQIVARDEWLRADSVFEMAWSRRRDEAERRLATLPGQTAWLQAATIALAWIYSSTEPLAAQRMLPADLSSLEAPLGLLVERIRHQIDPSIPEPALLLPYAPGALPDGSSLQMARDIIERFGITSPDGLYPSGVPVPQDRGVETPTYVAEEEAPIIVAAVRDEWEGVGLLTDYIALHAANPYADYRNRSLWAVLGSVACLPDSHSALLFVTELIAAALAPSPVRFADGLRLSICYRRVRNGADAAPMNLQRELDRRSAADLTRSRISDRWSHSRRLLAAHAEETAALGDTVSAGALVDAALGLPFGFAGYQAPADLLLAESNMIVRPHDDRARLAAMNSARSSAHNVQDPSFCARTTAGVAAIERCWSRPVGDVEQLVGRFVADATAVEFAARHMVGDTFPLRDQSTHLPINSVSDAITLEQLALGVFHLPVAAFEAVNPGLGRDERLDHGSFVAVPDPGFAAVFASWLSAQVVAAALEAETRTRLLAQLLPVAVANPTILDTILARLVRVAPTVDLDGIELVSKRIRTVTPSGDVHGMS